MHKELGWSPPLENNGTISIIFFLNFQYQFCRSTPGNQVGQGEVVGGVQGSAPPVGGYYQQQYMSINGTPLHYGQVLIFKKKEREKNDTTLEINQCQLYCRRKLLVWENKRDCIISFHLFFIVYAHVRFHVFAVVMVKSILFPLSSLPCFFSLQNLIAGYESSLRPRADS